MSNLAIFDPSRQIENLLTEQFEGSVHYKIFPFHSVELLLSALQEQVAPICLVNITAHFPSLSLSAISQTVEACRLSLIIINDASHALAPFLTDAPWVIRFVKPFHLGALLKKIEELKGNKNHGVWDIGSHILDTRDRVLTQKNTGESICLTVQESDLLVYLCLHAGRPISRSELLENVWGYKSGSRTHTVEAHVYRLRKKIDAHPNFLCNSKGGYQLSYARLMLAPPYEPMYAKKAF